MWAVTSKRILLRNCRNGTLQPHDLKKAVVESFNMDTTKIDLMSNNHFNFLGEMSDPEALISIRIQVVKDMRIHQIYMDLSIFSESMETWKVSKFISKLQDMVKPDRIAARQDHYDLSKDGSGW